MSNEDPMFRPSNPDVAAPIGEIETAMTDLRQALEEDDTVEKHYHVRSAMQRLQLLVDRTDRPDPR